MIDETYHYGVYSYDPENKALIIPGETRPNQNAAATAFFTLSENKLHLLFGIGWDMGTPYYWDDTEDKEITEEQAFQYFSKETEFDWMPMLNVEITDL